MGELDFFHKTFDDFATILKRLSARLSPPPPRGYPSYQDLAASVSLSSGPPFHCNIRTIASTMTSDEAKQRAQRLFKQPATNQPNGPAPDYEARSREIHQKIEYLRSLRLAAQTRAKPSDTSGSSD